MYRDLLRCDVKNIYRSKWDVKKIGVHTVGQGRALRDWWIDEMQVSGVVSHAPCPLWLCALP